MIEETNKKIRYELAKYPNRLQERVLVLLNIVNGHVADGKVDVDNKLNIANGLIFLLCTSYQYFCH